MNMNHNVFRIRPVLALAALLVVAAPAADAGLVVKFFGTATAGDLSPSVAQRIEQSGVDVEGFGCFQAPLLDPASGRQIGTGVDCLNVFDASGDVQGDGLQLEAKTFFLFRGGMIVNHACTSVRPFFAGVGDAGVTHITGSIPAGEFGVEPAPIPACEDAGGVVLTTGRFRNHSGEVRLSGAVDLSQAGADVITFSCVFVLDLDPFGPGNHGDGDDDDDDDN